MNIKEENICRLCFAVAENEFAVVDDNIREMFDVLLSKVNLDISENPIVCQDCAEITIKTVLFKSACIDTERIILSFAVDKTDAKFDLKEIYKDSKGVKTDKILNICRFCMKQLEESNFVSMDHIINNAIFAEMLPLFMPEMDFNITKNPVICTSCRQHLECYFNFIQNCLNTEGKINMYCQHEGTNDVGYVKLHDILHFLCKPSCKPSCKCAHMSVIKEEAGTFVETDSVFFKVCDKPIKTEELDMEYEKVILNKTPDKILSHTILSEVKAYIHRCMECSYETNNRQYLKKHMLIHKTTLEAEMYKCASCTYETKSKKYFWRHMRIHKDASEVKVYKCTSCTYETKNKFLLRSHIRIHKDPSEIEMYNCTVCTFRTKYKSTLKIHTLIHKDTSEVEMHKCATCTYKTKFKNNLKIHALIHRDPSEVPMHKCVMCTYETKYKDSLKRHMLTHNTK